MEMSVQSLWCAPSAAGRLSTAPTAIWLRRSLVLCGSAALTAAAAWQMYLVLTVNGGGTLLQFLVLALYVVLFAWIALSFVTAVAGFLSRIFGGRTVLGIDSDRPLPKISTRCALLVPTYNEAPDRLMARVQAVYESLEEAGGVEHFDFYILSDTTDAEIWIEEERQFLALRDRTKAPERIFYRHRFNNEGRKAGNIAEWIRRFGGHYEWFIVLDADSLMTGDTVVRLADAMERNSGVALIQTLPRIVNADTVFARLQQFAGRLYGPVVGRGISWWYGAEGNYWGHNAIIQLQAFASAAGLPRLRGPKPFGGDIMSHDFVEAALIRRRGWAVHLAPDLGGSFEEAPPSLDDYTTRDRRWCQGNLQHIGVLAGSGLHWISRLHLLMGIGSYITSPIWLVFLLLGMLISLQARFIRPEYFPSDFSLFPKWPVQDPYRSAFVFIATMTILILPKFIGLIGAVTRRDERRGSGGGFRVLLSVLVEIVVSGLLAPIMMWGQSIAVLQILLGRDAGWSVQRRDASSTRIATALQRYAAPTVGGALLGGAAYIVSVPLLYWMVPVIVGLILAAPLATLTSSARIGQAMRRAGLLLVSEEQETPPILARANTLVSNFGLETETLQVWRNLLTHGEFFDFHFGTLSARKTARRGEINTELIIGMAKLDQCESLEDALEVLTNPEKKALLLDREALTRLKQLLAGTLGPASSNICA